MIDYLYWLVSTFNQGTLHYFTLANSLYLFLFLLSSRDTWRHLKELGGGGFNEMRRFHLSPFVSVLVPAYNEEASVLDSVRALLQLDYDQYEVVVINDGSKDRTLETLIAAFDLKPVVGFKSSRLETELVHRVYVSPVVEGPRLVVIDKDNGGKADALNAGLNYAKGSLFCVTDADSILERDALLRTVKPFLDHPETVAVGGIVRLANGSRFEDGRPVEVRLPRSVLANFQVVEYLRAFLFGRAAWSHLNALMIIAGAFGLFRRETVIELGGFRRDRVGEDMDLAVRLHRYCRERQIPYRMSFVGDPVCWTQAPTTYQGLAKQRNRWQRGLLEVLWDNKGLCFNPRYGLVGLVAYPAYLLVEALGPLIEGAGYLVFATSLVMGWVAPDAAVMFFGMAVVYGVFLSTGSVLLEEVTYRRYPRWQDTMRLIGYGILENFGYRQLHVWWRLVGTWDWLRGKHEWGAQVRTGFKPVAPKQV